MAFGQVFDFLMNAFRGVITLLKNFNLGPFNLLQLFVAALVLELIISAVFVTFRAGSSSGSGDRNE